MRIRNRHLLAVLAALLVSLVFCVALFMTDFQIAVTSASFAALLIAIIFGGLMLSLELFPHAWVAKRMRQWGRLLNRVLNRRLTLTKVSSGADISPAKQQLAIFKKAVRFGFSSAVLENVLKFQQHSNLTNQNAKVLSEYAALAAEIYLERGEIPEAVAQLEIVRLTAPALLQSPVYSSLARKIQAVPQLSQLYPDWADAWRKHLSRANSHFLRLNEIREQDDCHNEWFVSYNAFLQLNGLQAVRPKVGTDAPHLDAIEPAARGSWVEGLPLVTVIVTAFNAERYLATALEGIQGQSWSNLEIIVVDDCSTDGTFKLAAEMARSDGRIIVVRSETNQGTYACRNLALAMAQGEFVTCHDSDDWSHPQKIELQLEPLLAEPTVGVASASKLIRVTEQLKSESSVMLNSSSLMSQRTLLIELGGWDQVRFSADSELIQRLLTRYGQDSITVVSPNAPLSLARNREDALTKAAGSSVKDSIRHPMGSRRLYREWYLWAIEQGIERTFSTERQPTHSFFTEMSPAGECDVLLATDFSLVGGTLTTVLGEARLFASQGKRVGLIHHPGLRHARDPINGRVWETLLAEPSIKLIPRGYHEEIRCRLLMFVHPPSFVNLVDGLPAIRAERSVLVVNQLPRNDYSNLDGEEFYDLAQVAAKLEEQFETELQIAPRSPAVRDALSRYHDDVGYAHLLTDEDWWTVYEANGAEPRLRPTSRQFALGRHSRDSQEKWLADPSSLRLAYPNANWLSVKILGGADTPQACLGKLPKNWYVIPFGAASSVDFLNQLDAYAYFPHEQLIEALGMVVVEAMSVGLPVILPPSFQRTFGEGATYCEPAEVLQLLVRLKDSPEYYRTCSEAALTFVNQTFTEVAHLKRVQRITGLDFGAETRP